MRAYSVPRSYWATQVQIAGALSLNQSAAAGAVIGLPNVGYSVNGAGTISALPMPAPQLPAPVSDGIPRGKR